MATPRRELFKAVEVCEVAEVQPYVLRSWEAEFPQLGQAPANGGPRVYRREDLEMVLRIKSLVFGEGLTLAGARRRLDEAADASDRPTVLVEEVLGARARERVRAVRDGLRSILQMLSSDGTQPELILAAPDAAAKRGGGKAARRRSA
jgi:DNA-binding transcriptional MerR regulator